jgi:DNA polymerase-3 subunit gamma/tau
MDDAAQRRKQDQIGSGAGSTDLGSQPAAAAPATAPGYRVLARKYRPSTFNDLIGQEAMVRTISNAFETNRIPQAWILTGVRGVGKTTTARILARALNYELPDGSVTGPTVHMPTFGVHCQAIVDSRHLDVIEMDAASHNGVDDVRQINDAVRYAPVSARYKVYILDEVHMVTTQGFNALLKTLEEPPPHAKFIFATTEIGKVPITVLSRCQRFDLRRITADTLVHHLAGIAGMEGIEAERDALALIARAAEGSVRDALSLFDQAIAHAAGTVKADDIRDMLGLADRSRIIDLFEAVLRGDMAAALAQLREQYEAGADPTVILRNLAEFTHYVTRVKAVPAVADDVSLSESERTRGRGIATKLSMRVLSRTWQMLLKGLSEMQDAASPIMVAEMILVRIAYAADLPTPDEALRALGDGGASNGGNAASSTGSSSAAPVAPSSSLASHGASGERVDAGRYAPRGSGALATAAMRAPIAATAQSSPQTATTPAIVLNRFEDLVALAAEKRDIAMKTALERDVRLVRFEDGKLAIAPQPSASRTLIADLQKKISLWTGKQWSVLGAQDEGAPTLREKRDEQKARFTEGVRADPLVRSVLERFPGAQIVDVQSPDWGAAQAATNGDMPDLDSDLAPDDGEPSDD